MKKLPCITDIVSHKFLLKDYGDTTGYAILFVRNSDCFIKVDKRIKGDDKMAEKKFRELYEYAAEFSYKSLKEIM
jgi:hypothetical protein